MGGGNPIGQSSLWIPEHKISVGTGQKGAFLRVQTEDFRRICAGESDELIGGQAARCDPSGPKDR